ncbi:MAG: hypothetical protein R3A10_15565 [Caldilineaceae bacterium]
MAQPFAVEWDSRGVANGIRLLTVLSFSADSGFNNASVEVTVDNPPPKSLLLSTAPGRRRGLPLQRRGHPPLRPQHRRLVALLRQPDVGLGGSFRHDVDAFDVTRTVRSCSASQEASALAPM